MGVSTDGIICYGCALPEEAELPWGAGDFDEWLAATEGGITAPVVEFSEATKTDYHAYWERRRAFIKRFPVALVQHCSGEYPMWIVAVRDTEIKAYRGAPKALDLAALQEIASRQAPALAAFIAKHHLPVEHSEPRWLLCSLWW